jgi:ABC-type polysaccharide/polyol phosphate export permease
MVDTLVGGVVLVAIMLFYRIGPGWAIVYLPLVVLVQVAFTTAVALFLSMANLFYRDVKYLFELVITVWMFATSVLYPTDLVTGTAGVVLRINPMTSIIDGYRNVLLYGRSPLTPPFALTAVAVWVLLLASAIVFHRAEFRFAESV